MLRIAVQTVRARWVSFAGSFLALAFGVAQVAAVGLLLFASFDVPEHAPQRFATAPALVFAADPGWDPVKHDLHQRSLAEAQGISAGLVKRLAETGPIVLDRTLEARVAGGPGDSIGHPWPVSKFGGYRLAAGRAPVADSEIVIGDGGGGEVGADVTVYTAAGPATYTVVGLTGAVGYERPIFFTPARAQQLSPRIHAVVAEGPLDRVRGAVGTEAHVLTGDSRHLVDDSRAQDLEDLDNTVTLLPIMAGVAGTTAIFVIASTFALTVIQRRREIALLRAVGATAKQVRRMVLGEAAVIGAAASLVGCALGLLGANVLAGWLCDLGVSPAWFGVHPPYGPQVWLPLLGSFLIGVLVAVLGVLVAARRAGRVGPTEALREAATDDTAGQGGRRWLGLAALLSALVVTGWTAFVEPSATLSPNNYVLLLLVPVVAFALLTPIAVGPLTRMLMSPLTGSHRAGPMLVRESALTARRRTAATAAPVLLTVGIAGSLLGATGSVSAARDDGVRNLVSADYVIVPAGAPGIAPPVVARIQAKVPGVEVLAPVRNTVYSRDEDRIEENDAQIMYGATLSTAFRLPMVSGSSNALDADSVVVPQAWGHVQGESVPLMLGDGRNVRLRVTGVYRALRGQDVAYLSPAYLGSAQYAADGLARRAYVTLRPGTDPAAAFAALRTETVRAGLAIARTDRFQVTEAAAAQRLISVRQRSVAVIVLLFCFIAVLNTLLMSTADRRRDLAVLRMAGATPRQVLTVFAGESLLVGVIGVVLGLGATALNLIGLQFALSDLFGSTSVQVPWPAVLAIALLGVALAVLGAVLPAVITGRASTSELAGLRE